jgi:hypothetical protein
VSNQDREEKAGREGLTLWRVQSQGQGKTDKESERKGGTHLLETAKGQVKGRKASVQGRCTCRQEMWSMVREVRVRVSSKNGRDRGTHKAENRGMDMLIQVSEEEEAQ